MSLEYVNLASALDGREYAADTTLLGDADQAPTLASIAVKIGTTRLIDNVMLE